MGWGSCRLCPTLIYVTGNLEEVCSHGLEPGHTLHTQEPEAKENVVQSLQGHPFGIYLSTFTWEFVLFGEKKNWLIKKITIYFHTIQNFWVIHTQKKQCDGSGYFSLLFCLP